MLSPGTSMMPDPILEAARLARAITDLLQRAAAVEPDSHQRSETRYAEALARTLVDQLAELTHSRAA